MTFRNGTKPGSTYARVTLTLELRVPSTWSPDTTLAQVYHQAKDDAEGIIRNYTGTGRAARIVGDIKVEAVTQSLDGVR